jgi:hypothetical protein
MSQACDERRWAWQQQWQGRAGPDFVDRKRLAYVSILYIRLLHVCAGQSRDANGRVVTAYRTEREAGQAP